MPTRRRPCIRSWIFHLNVGARCRSGFEIRSLLAAKCGLRTRSSGAWAYCPGQNTSLNRSQHCLSAAQSARQPAAYPWADNRMAGLLMPRQPHEDGEAAWRRSVALNSQPVNPERVVSGNPVSGIRLLIQPGHHCRSGKHDGRLARDVLTWRCGDAGSWSWCWVQRGEGSLSQAPYLLIPRSRKVLPEPRKGTSSDCKVKMERSRRFGTSALHCCRGRWWYF